MSVNLTNNVDDVRLRNGDVVTVTFNSAGREGYLVDCFVGYDDHDNTLSWDIDGSSMDGDNDFDIVEVISHVA